MADVAQDSDADSWVFVHSDNPADSSDDDAGVRSLSSGYSTPDCRSDDEHLAVVIALSSAGRRCRRRSRTPPLDTVAEDDAQLEDAEEVPQPPPPAPKPLSGVFHHTAAGAVTYATFDPAVSSPHNQKELIADPSFSACGEPVTILASNRGLVCLRANASGNYIVANPFAYTRVRLPRHACDHFAYGDPGVVIAFDDAYTCCDAHAGHYHVVVAFSLGDGIYTYESFSSRTWDWTLANEVNAVEQVVPASGVGALGCAFWRTTIGYILCYNLRAGTTHLIPAPEQVQDLQYWEIGEMNGTLSVTCTNDRVSDLFVLNLAVNDMTWSLVGQFEGGCLRNRDRVQLLRSQGPEVVMWDPKDERVVAMDLEGRTTRTIGHFSGLPYYPDFIPFVSSSTGITSIEARKECIFPPADAEA